MYSFLFDGTFPGLLTAVFESYERHIANVTVCSSDTYQPALLGDTIAIVTAETKARRVWAGLAQRLERSWLDSLYASFLAEQPAGYQHLFSLARLVFDQGGAVVGDYRNPHVLQVSALARKVHREKHRMEAFVRFQQLGDGIYYAAVKPDYNVLPLIASHFKNRYADQYWIIYDIARHYGLHYDGFQVEEVQLTEGAHSDNRLNRDLLAEDESRYQQLWKAYFRNASIKARKNSKLHTKHIPKRYWPFLTEKQPV